MKAAAISARERDQRSGTIPITDSDRKLITRFGGSGSFLIFRQDARALSFHQSASALLRRYPESRRITMTSNRGADATSTRGVRQT
jgi:hypothetical protein